MEDVQKLLADLAEASKDFVSDPTNDEILKKLRTQIQLAYDELEVGKQLTDHIKGSVVFQYYKDGSLWYKTEFTGLVFPVPIADIGTATFLLTDKGILFMRYIRKWVGALNLLKETKE
jgi:hypothetical protein